MQAPVCSSAAAVSLIVVIWWYKWLFFSVCSHWGFLASLAYVMAIRWWHGGVPNVVQEINEIWKDLRAPVLSCLEIKSLTLDSFKMLLLDLHCICGYAFAYGPFSAVMWKAVAVPARVLWQFGTLLWEDVMPPYWSIVLLVLVLLSHFFHQLLISVFLHRFFSHRCFVAGRITTFVFALAACIASQRGPIWWAATHRRHHKYCAAKGDPHSPCDGFLHSHLFWLFERSNFRIQAEFVEDWLKYPELLLVDVFFLDIYGVIAP